VQIFGTDIDAAALETARTAVYPPATAAEVTPERLERFFTQEKYLFKIRKEIRAMAVFAEQDVAKDPPFTKMDLVCCRNLLIYLESPLQKRLLATFNYALKPEGFLFLGSSESIGPSTELFTPIDNRAKIFKREDAPFFKLEGKIPSLPNISGFRTKPYQPAITRSEKINSSQVIEKMLLESYPPCAVINESNEVVYIPAHTEKYLEPTVGEPSLNILSMAREGLRSELRSALRRATAQKSSVKVERLLLKGNENTAIINLTVQPIAESRALQGLMLVIFEDASPVPDEAPRVQDGRAQASDQDIQEDLENELKYTREQLHQTIEEFELSYEEAASTNEELMSSNEEMQSVNEELETSKEELQSLYEELVAVNNELQNKIGELSSANDDIRNLLNSTQIATVFLDTGLCIKRATPLATDLINIMPADTGRPLGHFSSNLQEIDLVREARRVLGTLDVVEREVQTVDGRWFLMRILPYKTESGLPAGVVLTFAGIDAQKREAEQLRSVNQQLESAHQALREREEHLMQITNNMHDIIMKSDAEGKIQYLSPSYERVMGYKTEDRLGSSVFETIHPDDLERAVFFFKTEVKEKQSANKMEYRGRHADGRYLWLEAAGSILPDDQGAFAGVVVGIRDISERKWAESALRKNEQEMARLDRLNLIGEIAAGIAHEIRNPMTVVRGNLQVLQMRVK
jgi:two-component system CheB/CheR fusion protein